MTRGSSSLTKSLSKERRTLPGEEHDDTRARVDCCGKHDMGPGRNGVGSPGPTGDPAASKSTYNVGSNRRTLSVDYF